MFKYLLCITCLLAGCTNKIPVSQSFVGSVTEIEKDWYFVQVKCGTGFLDIPMPKHFSATVIHARQWKNRGIDYEKVITVYGD